MTKTVTIFGATGAQGFPVAVEAIKAGHNVRAVATDEAKVAALHPKAESFAASLNDEDAIYEALNGADAAFLHLPMAQDEKDPEIWLGNFIKAAHRAKLPLLVYTTGSQADERYRDGIVFNAAHQSAEALIGSGIPSIILHPTIYLENLKEDLFVPGLKSEGVFDYPPFKAGHLIQFTSHLDQAKIAVAAFSKPELAGNRYNIGSPDALTGDELAVYFSNQQGRKVSYQPTTPEVFGQRIGEILQSPGTGYVLSDLYKTLNQFEKDDMVIDIEEIEKIFDVKLTKIEDHIKNW